MQQHNLYDILAHAFGEQVQKFTVSEPLPIQDLIDKKYTACPGVYVFAFTDRDEKDIIKVGKHQEDLYGRAAQHIHPDNTTSADGKICMRDLLNEEYSDVRLFAVTVKTNDDNLRIPWILAIEAYLELFFRDKERLLIPSHRVG